MFKKTLALVMSMFLLFSFQFAASAEDKITTCSKPIISINETEIMPLYNYASSCTARLDISNSTAKCITAVNGYAGTTTKIEITMTLQHKTLFWWSKVEKWSTTINNYTGTLGKSIAVKSDTYRVKAEITVYSGSNSEKITAYSAEKTC